VKASDYNRIIRSLLKDEFELIRECKDGDLTAEFRHKKCGHCFTRTAQEIAYNGLRCNRCYGLSREETLYNLQEQQALEIYDKCMKKLGPGYEVKGDTSSLDNEIEVVRVGKDYFIIKIDDLLNDRNLPEYLIHCTLKEKSVQMQILQNFVKPRYELLSDFSSLDDIISVRDNNAEKILKVTVKDLLVQ